MYAILFILTIFGISYVHEVSHMGIYESFGIQSEINFFPTLKTIPINQTESKTKCLQFCKLSHNNADSFLYPFLLFCFLVGVIGFFIIALLEEIIENEN